MSCRTIGYNLSFENQPSSLGSSKVVNPSPPPHTHTHTRCHNRQQSYGARVRVKLMRASQYTCNAVRRIRSCDPHGRQLAQLVTRRPIHIPYHTRHSRFAHHRSARSPRSPSEQSSHPHRPSVTPSISAPRPRCVHSSANAPESFPCIFRLR